MSDLITTAQGLVTRTRRLAAATTKRLARETGQTAAEYMGVLLVIALLIGVLANTNVGKQISDGVSAQITKITDTQGPGAEAPKGNKGGGSKAKPAGKKDKG